MKKMLKTVNDNHDADDDVFTTSCCCCSFMNSKDLFNTGMRGRDERQVQKTRQPNDDEGEDDVLMSSWLLVLLSPSSCKTHRE